MALLWDFAREIGTDALPGGITSYYQESCQRMYIKGGQILTDHGQVLEGKWQDFDTGEIVSLSAGGYTLLDIEHHYNGRLYAIACKEGKIVYLMHAYKTGVRCSK